MIYECEFCKKEWNSPDAAKKCEDGHKAAVIQKGMRDKEMRSLVSGYREYFDLIDERDAEIDAAVKSIVEKYGQKLDTLDEKNTSCLHAYVSKYGYTRAMDLLCYLIEGEG